MLALTVSLIGSEWSCSNRQYLPEGPEASEDTDSGRMVVSCSSVMSLCSEPASDRSTLSLSSMGVSFSSFNV